mgnify:FL=1
MSDSRALFGGGNADANADVLRAGIARACHQLFRRSIDGGAFASDAHTGCRIDEAASVACHDLQTAVGGVRGHEEDSVKSMTVRSFDPFTCLVWNEIRSNQAGATGIFKIACENVPRRNGR